MENQNRIYKLLLGVALIAELVGFALVHFDNTKKQERIERLEKIINNTHLDTLITKTESINIDGWWRNYSSWEEPLNLLEMNDKLDKLIKATGYEYTREVRYKTTHYEDSKLEKIKSANSN